MTSLHSRTAPSGGPAHRARAAGVLLGTACGDALGAGYEFGPPLGPEIDVEMKGGGNFNWAPGEWTDDTSLAIAIAQTALEFDLTSAEGRDELTGRWIDWARTAPDVGIQTSRVLHEASAQRNAEALRNAALELHEQTGRTAGNGSLMRTAPVALACLDDPVALMQASRDISSLTHPDEDAADACMIWCLAIRHAITYANFDGLDQAIDLLEPHRRGLWRERLAEAEANPPDYFARNGWVVHALQAAWSAIVRTPVPQDNPAAGTYAAQHFRLALEAAVRGGRDTDTVAAIAGGLLGARWGVSAIPVAWQRIVHGWPGLRSADLVRLAQALAYREPLDAGLDYSWLGHLTAVTPHPRDAGVLLGPVGAVPTLPPEVDAVVSLCRVDADYVPATAGVSDRAEVWLVDSAGPADNAHVLFTLNEAADAVLQLRAGGRTVFLHCAAGQSRTPTVAALVGARLAGITPAQALAEVLAVLPEPQVNPYFASLIAELSRPAAEAGQ